MADEDEDVYDFEIYGDNGMSYLAQHPTATAEDGSPVMTIEWREEKYYFRDLDIGETFWIQLEFNRFTETEHSAGDYKKLILRKISREESERLHNGERVEVEPDIRISLVDWID